MHASIVDELCALAEVFAPLLLFFSFFAGYGASASFCAAFPFLVRDDAVSCCVHCSCPLLVSVLLSLSAFGSSSSPRTSGRAVALGDIFLHLFRTTSLDVTANIGVSDQMLGKPSSATPEDQSPILRDVNQKPQFPFSGGLTFTVNPEQDPSQLRRSWHVLAFSLDIWSLRRTMLEDAEESCLRT